MKSPKQRYLDRTKRAKTDRRGPHAFRTPKAARRKAVRTHRRAVEAVGP